MAAAPGAGTLREIVSRTPGSWLYHRPVLSWLSEAQLRAQLPRAYRWFALYCAMQSGDPVGAEPLLRLLIRHRERKGLDDRVPLRCEGSTVVLDLHDPRFLRVPGELRGLSALMTHYLGAGDSFLDIGANHGAYAVAAAALLGSTGFVLAVEPQARLAHVVEQSLRAGPTPFEVHPVACGDAAREVELHVPLATSGSAGLFAAYSASAAHRTARVPMRPLDDIVDPDRLRGRVFMKLDVEGSEISVLRGARRTIAATRPAILCEVNAEALAAAGASTDDLIATLRTLGYDRFATRERPGVERPLDGAICERDIIARHRGSEA